MIVQQLETASSSSGYIYRSESTKNMSEEGNNPSERKLEPTQERVRNSVLIRELEREAPGITNEGWINLFIKDENFTRANNNYMRNRNFSLKRSASLTK